MARYDFSAPRLHVEGDLAAGSAVPLTKDQAHYLTNVLRLGNGDAVMAFNGRDGEWRCALEGRKAHAALVPGEMTRPQPAAPPLHLLFAPLKHARLDYMVQKAVEMGAGVLQPVITRRTQAARVNEERMRANAVEAAEQCGILHVPEVRSPARFDALLAGWDAARLMVFCDEDADVADPLAALRGAPRGPAAVIIGPEGGFDEGERAALLALPRRLRLSLGPRILRADTAAVAALALVGAVLGDIGAE
ncbi:16S rRNA (uracil(1498)-N(3))-methyltransferase [Lichenibacterium dinghuense]|uniref:16S rRNA (uracil(1498)-N(3))-methyltransferase n=1 Tax=Lichenibacterium dinghuense TaxID=2895977 RepID=UPI001EFF6F33|nr:16S rRNA (uracil(1498)-N(3))-methyltransferase [Lichenibacterium sp. 6Y81]